MLSGINSEHFPSDVHCSLSFREPKSNANMEHFPKQKKQRKQRENKAFSCDFDEPLSMEPMKQ